MAGTYVAPVALERRHRLDTFDCGEPALDEWLRRHAPAAHRSGASRVFVLTLAGDPDTVVGFHALAAYRIRAVDAIDRLLKGQPTERPVPAALLARLAVDQAHQGRGVGRSLLVDAVRRVHAASQSVGIRALAVHAKNERARDWYQAQGFAPSASDPNYLMVLMKDLRPLLGD